MYEEYTRQSLPSKEYRELLGSAICVFNSNNAFVIENILSNDIDKKYSWYELIDKVSGNLHDEVKNTISKFSNEEIASLFKMLVQKRNRIIHSFQVTNIDGNQILCTKDKSHNQYIITEEYLLIFIKENEKLSQMLHDFRGH